MPFSDIKDYYRFLDPKIDIDSAQIQLANPTEKNKITDLDKTKLILDKYVNTTVPGAELVEDSQLKNTDATPPDIYFNTIHQGANEEQTKKLFDDSRSNYWKYVDEKEKKPTLTSIDNYYKQVCEAEGSSAGPPVDLTINVLRSPLITPARRGVDDTALFLNYMPPTFASNMIPYLDVEFQLPVTDKDSETGQTLKRLNRPSLLRFLLGSKDFSNIPLTAADASLVNTIDTPNRFNENAKSTFVGMEYFTTPQTLTNMDGLLGNTEDRLNDVQPFLPPATLLSANIEIRGLFYEQDSTTATLEFKIHDKNRLSEFSEFIRGPHGYNGKAPGGSVLVWLTYGWLAPRGNEHDEYARFINSRMLTRMAFTVNNSTFSFDTLGQVNVSLTLAQATGITQKFSSLDKVDTNQGRALEKIYEELRSLISQIQEDREIFGQPAEGMKEIRIYQLLDDTSDINYSTDIPADQRDKVIADFIKQIDAGKTVIKSDADKKKAKETLGKLKEFFDKKKIVESGIRNWVSSRLDRCYDSYSPDPFLPTSEKKEYFSKDLISNIENSKINYKNFDQGAALALNLWERDKPVKAIPVDVKSFQRSIISFGKLFSVFCVPSLLESCKVENVTELQINFYQFNGSCGPMSYHNIAEFPIDVRRFVTQFQSHTEKVGTTRMTVEDFVAFVVETQLSDMKSRAWGMSELYTPYALNDTELKKSQDFNKKNEEWMKKYKEFNIPALTVQSEVVTGRSGNSFSNVDLLSSIASRVGGHYDSSFKKGLIRKIHIFDKSHDPYNKITDKKQRIYDIDGNLISIPEADVADFAQKGLLKKEEIIKKAQEAGSAARILNKGKGILRELYSNTIPTITYGTEGTLVRNFSLASKADGTIGAINLLGGSQQASSDLSPNGLHMKTNKLPIRVTPAETTMTTAGCPLASQGQFLYLDFGTGTTLDNMYIVNKVQHSMGPGRFETSWTLGYTDSYGKLFSPGSFDQLIKDASPPPPPPEPAKKPAAKKK